MANTKAILFTISTYGTWLRGDPRGWVDDGIVFPHEPYLQAWDREHMKHSPYLFPRDRWLDIGQAMGDALISRLNQRIYALTVQGWHVHGMIGSTRQHIADIIKCAKDAVRWHLRIDRPIWASDYDKRFCYSWEVVQRRIEYVERHNLRIKWPAQPWSFLKYPSELEFLR